MKLRIGVMGSGLEKGENNLPKKALQLAFDIGKEIARHNCVLVNGACWGIPYEASKGAKSEDGFVLGVSPAENLHEHVHKYRFPTNVHDMIIYTGFGFKGRNVVNVTNCDAVVIVGGHVGTLNEFTIAYDEGMVVGVMQGSGGIADFIDDIIKIAAKKTGAALIYDKDPHELVRKVITEAMKREKGTEQMVLRKGNHHTCKYC
ncbi:LOG family protein [Candidatus Woesearchaeota archaeon]|nr:LOG family protein [Candidatus Woesearchaeota archaeon]